MKTNDLLQLIFAIFLGLVVVAFVGIGVNTFYPEPVWDGGWSEKGPPEGYVQWQLVTSVILLVCATLILAVSLLLPDGQAVLSNGLLLGGVFTMMYAVGVSVSSQQNVLRFAVVTVALAITIAIGYLKFVRGRRVRAAAQPALAGGEPISGELAARLVAVEQKLDALRRALRE